MKKNQLQSKSEEISTRPRDIQQTYAYQRPDDFIIIGDNHNDSHVKIVERKKIILLTKFQKRRNNKIL